MPIGSAAPIENSPLGIQTIPSGAAADGPTALATVGRNADPDGIEPEDDVDADVEDFEYVATIATVTPAATATMPAAIASERPRRETGASRDERDGERRCRLLTTVYRAIEIADSSSLAATGL